MRQLIFSIFDSKAEAYLRPFYAPTVGSALRDWETACNDPDTAFFKHPGDYTLVELGSFENETAEFTIDEHHTNHGTALIQKKTQQTPFGELPLPTAAPDNGAVQWPNRPTQHGETVYETKDTTSS